MGFFFTLLYIMIAFLTPAALFGAGAEYHIQFVLVGLALVFSIPNLAGSEVMKSRQAFAVLAFSGAIFLSVALTGWFGGGIAVFYGFLQNALAFFLLAINCKSKRHLQVISLALILGCTWFILLAVQDLQNQVVPSVYLFGDGVLRRIRGLGFVNDPNDFAQILVSLIPTVFLWKRPGWLLNIFLVGVPLFILLAGLFLTHSRGGILALTAVVLISARRKVGTLPASLVAGLLFVVSLASGGSGGRDVSMDAGADRLDLWASGLEIIKAHPLFGVGIGGFADANGITAHNSVVICAAETGLVGLFFWTMFLFSSFREAVLYDKAANAALAGETDETAKPIRARASLTQATLPRAPLTIERNPLSRLLQSTVPHPFASPPPHRGLLAIAPSVPTSDSIPLLRQGRYGMDRTLTSQPNAFTVSEVSGTIRILIASLTGFLVAGWFLSRALSMWLFMFGGMLYAAIHMGAEMGLVPAKDSNSFTARWSFAVTISLIVLISIILRLRNFTR